MTPGWEVTVIVLLSTVRLWVTKRSLLYPEEMVILGNTESIWLKYTVCLFSFTRAKAASWELQSHQSNCRGCDGWQPPRAWWIVHWGNAKPISDTGCGKLKQLMHLWGWSFTRWCIRWHHCILLLVDIHPSLNPVSCLLYRSVSFLNPIFTFRLWQWTTGIRIAS